METKITVVMASYLGSYQGAASQRDLKIHRAIESVFNQTFQEFELLLMSDGCEKTRAIYLDILASGKYDSRLKYHEVPRLGTWGGNPRNGGIDNATGKIIIYLDIDDYYLSGHLQHVWDNFGNNEMVYFDDLLYNFETESFDIVRKTRLACSQCGTSSIAHLATLKSRWPVVGNYAHDWKFIMSLTKECKSMQYIGTAGYCVCHIPQRYDV